MKFKYNSMTLDQYFLYSTILSIFSEAFLIHVGFDLKFSYLIAITNLFLFGLLKRICIFSWFFFLLLILLLLIIYHVLFDHGTVYLTAGLSQILGISIMGIYFSSFYNYFETTFKQVWDTYLRFSVFLNKIGIVIFLYHGLVFKQYRFYSIMNEPAHYAAIFIPAYHYFLMNYKKYTREFWLSACCMLLTMSLIGYLGLLLSGFIAVRGSLRVKLLSLLFLSMIGYGMYSSIGIMKLKLDDTIRSFASNDLTEVNLSTYAMMSNLVVTELQLRDTPLLGAGLGMHEFVHEKYFSNLKISQFNQHATLNAKDANSLALRLLSECGLIGFMVVVFALFYFRVKHGEHSDISNGIFIYFLLKLLREGNYFPPEFYFFVMAYYIIGSTKRRAKYSI